LLSALQRRTKLENFEEWLSGISKAVSRRDGSMGIDIIRLTDKESKPGYVIIFRFNNYDKSQ
jgi:antibiotic biosynthesis monooxygenase (ABM) superfamily enzyme